MDLLPRIILPLALFNLLALGGCATRPSSSAEPPPQPTADLSHRQGTLVVHAAPGSTVEVEQLEHAFWFGAALANGIFDGGADSDDVARYKEAFLENFNAAVTENALKWHDMQPDAGPVHYGTVDAMLAWTETHDIPLRGHNIFWGIPKFVQPWVMELSDEALRETLEERALDIANRYEGRFAHYDLNNEMIHGNYYEDRLGKDITRLMALWVKEADPSAQLYLNDYDILTGRALEAFLVHIRELLEDGVPIDGIGVQGHLHGSSFDPDAVRHALDELAQFGLPIIITEFNFPGQRSKFYREPGEHAITTAEEEAKAKAIVDYYRICFAHPAVEGILMWGFWEGANWIPESSLYREDWSPTPALHAYQDLVFGEWWTRATVEADDNGRVEIPAFFGTHAVTVDGVRREVELAPAEATVTVDYR